MLVNFKGSQRKTTTCWSRAQGMLYDLCIFNVVVCIEKIKLKIVFEQLLYDEIFKFFTLLITARVSHFFQLKSMSHLSLILISFITEAFCKPWAWLRKQWSNFTQEFCGLSSNLALLDCSNASFFAFPSFFFLALCKLCAFMKIQ